MRLAAQLPNALSVARLLLTPWVAVLLLRHDYQAALWWVGAAGLTDALDGFVARRFGWESQVGAYLDPVADKALLVTLFLCLGALRAAPAWLIWLVFGRDLVILTGSIVLLLLRRARALPPTRLGKVSTIVQVVTVLLCLVRLAYPALVPAFTVETGFVATAALALITGVQYTRRGWQLAEKTPPVKR